MRGLSSQEVQVSLKYMLSDKKWKAAKTVTSLLKYDDVSFLRVLGALVAWNRFRNACSMDIEEAFQFYYAPKNKNISWGHNFREGKRFQHIFPIWIQMFGVNPSMVDY